MAGTRLYVQGAVLVQLVVLVLLAVLLGLSDDVPIGGWIFKLRFLHRDSSSLAENAPNTSLSVPVIRVAVLSQEQRDEWTSEKIYLGQVDVQVLDQDTVALLEQSICRTETAQQPSKIMNNELESYDLVMCDGERVWQQLGDGQWVPAPLASLREALPPFIRHQQRRRRLQVTLVIESSTSTHLDWRWWAQAVDNSLLQAIRQKMWPSYCLDDDPALIETQVVWDDLLAQRASQTSNDDAQPRTISSRQAISWLDKTFPTTSPGTVRVVVYVVGSDSVFMDDTKRTSMALLTDSHLFVLVNGATHTDEDPIVLPPLVPLVEHGLCWQNPIFQNNDSTMIFRWQVKRWLQDLLTNLDAESHHQATLAAQTLRKAPWNVVITDQMVHRYQEAVHARDEARAAVATGNFLAAVQYLEDSLEASERVLKDPQLLAPLDMLPSDQYLAVVAPLLFPLLIPFAVGLVREVKRYQTLKLKQV